MGCNVQDIVSWYQKKIGTYDKQQWEKTVERRILSGYSNVPMRATKLKTDLIDVDLVRGSAFTKTKPKHGIITVTKLGALRMLFLPFFRNWWISQTSHLIFYSIFALYALQLLNTILYFSPAWIQTGEENSDAAGNATASASEILAPFAMMTILSIIHSHIVSTHPINASKLNNKNGAPTGPSSSRRVRRMRRRAQASARSRQQSAKGLDSSPEAATSGIFVKRARTKTITIDDIPSVKNRRNVGWEATPIKGGGGGGGNRSASPPATNASKQDEEADASPITAKIVAPKCCVSMNDAEQLSAAANRITEGKAGEGLQEDDGFESFEGTASSDSLTASQVKLDVSDLDGNDNDNNVVALTDLVTCARSVSTISHHQKGGGVPPPLEECAAVADDELTSPSYHRPIAFNFRTNGANILKEDNDSDKDTDDTDASDDDDDPICDNSVKKQQQHQQQQQPESENEEENDKHRNDNNNNTNDNKKKKKKKSPESSCNSSADEDSEVCGASPQESVFGPFTEGTTSAGEWIGVTTNSEECSYSSELDASDNQMNLGSDNEHLMDWDMEMMPNVILNSTCAATGKVSCVVYAKREVKKANLSVLDISSAIIARVEAIPENVDYFYLGLLLSVLVAVIPAACRFTESLKDSSGNNAKAVSSNAHSTLLYCPLTRPTFSANILSYFRIVFGATYRDNAMITIAMAERFCLAAMFFFLLTVAERTFKQRFLYAKFFAHLTSFRRARKSDLPHFRLNKVRNIKSWLSIRSYLKKRGPQRSVDVIVSAAFLIMVVLLSFLSVELIKDMEYNVEVLGWAIVMGIFILRFMTLGAKINRKYRNLSTIITEQINLYLQVEQKPNKKDELMVANSVLKLASDLLKELESPFKISGLSANPYLYTFTKVVMVSALSGILSEIFGFKLKLHKIKIK